MQEKPKWQLYLEKEKQDLEQEWGEDITEDLFPIVTPLLLDDGDPVAASQKAAREFIDLLVNKWVPKDTARRTFDEPDDTPPLYTKERSLELNFESLGNFIYGLVPELPYPGIEHDKILYFLLHIKELWNQANFDAQVLESSLISLFSLDAFLLLSIYCYHSYSSIAYLTGQQKNSDLKFFEYGLEIGASESAGAIHGESLHTPPSNVDHDISFNLQGQSHTHWKNQISISVTQHDLCTPCSPDCLLQE
jgi:hypothetical protein